MKTPERRSAVERASVMLGLSVLVFLLLLEGTTARAVVRDYAVEVSASIQEAPPRISLSWPADATADHYYVFKKACSDSLWGDPIAVLDGAATEFVDEDVFVGEAYEYSFRKTLDVATDTLQVPAGLPVTFTIYDSWGDGMCCHHGLGAYEVRCDGATYAAGGDFGASESTSFTVGVPGGSDVEFVVSLTLDVWAAETTWELTNDVTGTALAEGGPYEPPRFGHIFAGIRYPAIEDRGAVLLVVASDVAAELASGIERLELDMIADGYRVRRLVVADGSSVPDVKDMIVTECATDPTIGSLFILGHVPVPYSGNILGAHANHQGAWPADLYYGELDGEWTDYLVTNTNASRVANHNVPGDGKFDQTFLPSDVDLMVGRVDLNRMPAFEGDEYALLQQYLDKDHAYRRGEFFAERRGLIDDNVGEAFGLAFAAVGWRNFTAMFGYGNVHALSYFGTLEQESYLWSYGCGGGTYTICAGVGTTDDFANNSPRTVFSPLYGSYFGDWDNSDNILRAPLASAGWPLVCFWAGCPTWHLHHMALGHTIGYSTRLTQNNDHEYTVSDGGRQVRVALMGDPTLTMHVVRPPSNLALSQPSADRVRLDWSPSGDAVGGYHVYRASGIRDVFDRVNASAITDTSFVDPTPLAGSNVYMVRALKLETCASGSYYNLSGGVVDSLVFETGVPEEIGFASCFPNPFANGTSIRYHVPADAPVRLRIFTVAGREVTTLVDERLTSNWYTTTWDGRDDAGRGVASGVYFCLLEVGGESATRRMVVLR